MKRIAVLLILIGLVGILFTAKDFFTREDIEGEKFIAARSVESIIIDSDVARVRVHPTTSDEIKVAWRNKSLSSSPTKELITIEEDGETLRITVDKESKFLFSINFFGFNMLNKRDIDVYLPEKDYATIKIQNDVGSVHVSSIKADEVIAKTNVSSVKLKDIHANKIQATSDVGLLAFENITGELVAKTNVGNISIQTEEINGDMELESDVGSISVTVARIPVDVNFLPTTDIGSVRVFGQKGSYVVDQAAYTVSIVTDVGSIKVKEE